MKSTKFIFLFFLLPLVTLALSILVGSANLDVFHILDILSHKLFSTATDLTGTQVTILWNIRIPRVLLAFMVGGALAVSGAIAQSVLQNPLASPYTLGVSSGASFGAGLVILASLQLPIFPELSQICFGFLFSLGTILFVLGLSFKVDPHLSNTSVVLTGMVISLFFNGLLTTLTALSPENNNKMTLWSMGSFALRGWDYLKLLTPFVVVGVLLSMALSTELDLLSFGSKDARAMGVDVSKAKTLAFLTMSMMTGACIALTGTIGFVDLIAPHVGRKWVGNRHIVLIPASFVVGGCLMTITDAFARTVISPSELPVGAVTSLLGAPFFFYVYQGRKSNV